jgi:hypothetical protein
MLKKRKSHQYPLSCTLVVTWIIFLESRKSVWGNENGNCTHTILSHQLRRIFHVKNDIFFVNLDMNSFVLLLLTVDIYCCGINYVIYEIKGGKVQWTKLLFLLKATFCALISKNYSSAVVVNCICCMRTVSDYLQLPMNSKKLKIKTLESKKFSSLFYFIVFSSLIPPG